MLFILRGISGSGKTRIAKLTFPSHCVISSDALRLEMYGTLQAKPEHTQMIWPELMRRLEFRCQHRMVTALDATHTTLKSVKKAIKIAEKWGCEYRIISLTPNMEGSIQTIDARRSGAIEGAILPLDALKSQYDRFIKGSEDIKKAYGYDNSHFFEGDVRDCITFIGRTLESMHHHVVYGEVFVIGDVHGYVDHLRDLLDSIPKNASIYSVGDLIDRGPDSIGSVEMLHSDPRFRGAVMGNHEFAFLKERIDGMECRSKARRRTHEELDGCDEQTQEQFMAHIKEMKPFIAIEHPDTSDKVYITHGGVNDVDPFQLSLHQTTGDRLNRVEGSRIFQVHGHMSWQYEEEPSIERMVNNLDSGVYETGILTAYNPFTGETIQVERDV